MVKRYNSATESVLPWRNVQSFRSARLVAIILGIVFVAVVPGWLGKPTGVGQTVMIIMLACLLLLSISFIRIETVIDSRGISVRSQVFRFTIRDISVSEIDEVSASEIRPENWGGVGLRFFSGGSALLDGIRPGITLGLSNGKRFALSFPDEATAIEAADALELIS